MLAPVDFARPGFDATYKLVFKNKGNQMQSGNVTLNFDDSRIDFVSSSPALSTSGVNTLTWNFTNLMPFENRSVLVTLNINSPVETPAVNIGDIINFSANINPIAGDELPIDNTFVYNQIVVGSFDPNDITCIEGATLATSQIGEYLHYIINFENTGNFLAQNIVVKDIIDETKFDVNSLQVLSSSDPMRATITANKAEFIFQNINKGPGGHGNVLFKIKTKSTLGNGSSVNKSANIYFDYNAPVATNSFQTTFATLSSSIFTKDDSISVYPNPANSIVNFTSNSTIKSIELYDVQGRILETQVGNVSNLDISNKTNGIYFVKITTDKGSKVEKIVKE